MKIIYILIVIYISIVLGTICKMHDTYKIKGYRLLHAFIIPFQIITIFNENTLKFLDLNYNTNNKTIKFFKTVYWYIIFMPELIGIYIINKLIK